VSRFSGWSSLLPCRYFGKF